MARENKAHERKTLKTEYFNDRLHFAHGGCSSAG